MEQKGSKAFWPQISAIDAGRLQARLQKYGGEASAVNLGEFQTHFDRIARAPHCEWFDYSEMDRIREIVNATLEDVTHN